MDFSKALRKLHFGKGIRLPHWEKGVVVIAQFPEENSKMTVPYLYVESQHGRVPWIPTFPELFNVKWESFELSFEKPSDEVPVDEPETVEGELV